MFSEISTLKTQMFRINGDLDIHNDSIMLYNTFRCLLRPLIFCSVLRLASSHVVYVGAKCANVYLIRGGNKNLHFLGVNPESENSHCLPIQFTKPPPTHPYPHPPTTVHLGLKMSLFAEKVGCLMP